MQPQKGIELIDRIKNIRIELSLLESELREVAGLDLSVEELFQDFPASKQKTLLLNCLRLPRRYRSAEPIFPPVRTLADVLQHTESRYREVRNMGAGGLHLLKEALRRKGLSLSR